MKINRKKLTLGFSRAIDGNMKFHEDENDSIASDNREKFFKKVGLPCKNLVSCKLVHGKKIAIVDKKDKGKIFSGYDGLITKDKNLILSITAADCLPIYFFGKNKKVIGMLHAGYKGVLKNAASAMVKSMIKNFSSNPKDIFVYIGPHIKKCHFEIGRERIEEFKNFSRFIIKRRNKKFVDLAGIVEAQLKDDGIKDKNIKINPECTYCEKKYFSFRRDKPEKVQAQIAYIYLK